MFVYCKIACSNRINTNEFYVHEINVCTNMLISFKIAHLNRINANEFFLHEIDVMFKYINI